MTSLRRAVLALVAISTTACGIGHAAATSTTSSTTAPRTTVAPTTVAPTTAPATSVPPTTVPPTTTTTTDPGQLPQTDTLPTAATPQFQAEMAALWQGVVQGSATPAMAAFFPESAYLQVKTIPDPAADWQQRLVQEFTLDLAAAHQLLGPDPSSATLQGVQVPSQYAHWVPPGVCDNQVGYYEVANSRVVYLEQGVVRSFGIASLISWRGAWYVVHLGAIVRSGSGGEVDDPEDGPGISAPSTSC